jgi:hypothetical protein
MPSRQFSAAIVGAVWPHSDPEGCQTVSEGQHQKGVELLECADRTRADAARVAAEQSGQTVDGFCDDCHQKAATYTAQADHYFAMSRVSEEVGRLLYGLREDLEKIDAEAHEAIQRIEQSMTGAMALVAAQQIMAIVAAARAEATALSVKVTAQIAAEGLKIGISQPGASGGGTSGQSGSGGTAGKSGHSGDPTIREAGWHPGGVPEAPPGERVPRAGDRNPDGRVPETGDGWPTPAGDKSPSGDPAGDRAGGPRAGKHNPDGAILPGGGEPAFPFGGGVPGGGGGGGAPSMPTGSPGGLGGLNMPSAPSGLGGGGLPTQGLTPPSGLGGGLPSSTGAMPPAATSSDFSRGLSAGLGGPAAPFAPPVAPPASTAAGSAAPAGALSSGPAPVTAAAGGPAVSSAASAASVAGPGGPAASGAGVPSGGMGPLPPFGSDVPRTAAVPTAAVGPASGGPASAPVVSGAGSAAGAVAPLPPGVVGSGVGAAAGAASEGIRTSLPDPLLASATQLVYQLLHDSRMYPFMDWCVGVFRTSSGIETLIVNSEGSGYIPAGVFVPRSARMLFADPGLSAEFRARWFSWANPAETVLAYAALAVEHREDVELWALAVSTDDGGSSMPARAVIQHYDDCSRATSPITEDAPASALDDRHAHRLETLDRALYARLTGFGDGPLPDRSEAWRTTLAAAQLALGRAGAIPDLAVAPAIREVLDLLGQGVPVPADRWQDLEAARIAAVMSGAGLRPGRAYSDGAASAHGWAYHDLTRLIELLLLWRLDGIAYPEIAYLAGQIHLTPHLSRRSFRGCKQSATNRRQCVPVRQSGCVA